MSFPSLRALAMRPLKKVVYGRPGQFIETRLRTKFRNNLDDRHLRLLLAFALPHDAHCIDVGAHCGDILRDMVRLAPDGRHMAFEPLPELADGLAREFPHVDVRRVALSDQSGSLSFVHVTNLPSHSGLKQRSLPTWASTEKISVEVQRLDDCLPDAFRPQFIKIDVEGGELGVLRGAQHTLETYRPIVWFEHGIGGADAYGTAPGDVFDLLVQEVGMRIFDADGVGPYSRKQFQEVSTEPMFNFVAHP